MPRHIRPITIISSASTAQQRAFFAELNEVAAQSSGSIRNFSLLSQVDSTQQAGRDYHHNGRISAQFLQAVLPLDDYEFYLCGPTTFMQSMYDTVRELGINDARIFAEEFGPASLKRDADHASDEFIAIPSASEAIIEFTDAQVEQAWSQEDGSLLDFAEAHGLSPDFGCRSGQCGACKTPLISGAISYQTEPSSPVGENEVLLCCAVPARVAGEDVVRLAIKI